MKFEKFDEFNEVLIYVLGNDKFDKYTAEELDNLFYATKKELKLNLVLAKTNEARKGVLIYCLSEIAWQKWGARTPNIPPYEGEEIHTIAYFNSLNFFIELEKLAYFYDIDYKTILDRMGLEILEYDLFENQTEKEIEFMEIELERTQPKIIFLEKLGVLDFIRKTQNNISENKMAELLKPIIGQSPNGIRKALERIRNGSLNQNATQRVVNTFNALNIKEIQN